MRYMINNTVVVCCQFIGQLWIYPCPGELGCCQPGITYLSRTKYRSKAPWHELSSSSSSWSSGSAFADGEETKNNPSKTRTRGTFIKNLAIFFHRRKQVLFLWKISQEKQLKVVSHPKESFEMSSLGRDAPGQTKQRMRARLFQIILPWAQFPSITAAQASRQIGRWMDARGNFGCTRRRLLSAEKR